MLCEICHENQVSYIISISENSSVREIRVCEKCATRKMDRDISDTDSETGAIDRKCRECGYSYPQAKNDTDEYGDLPMLGCPVCYIEFHDELTPLLRRLHGDTIHTGKKYSPERTSRRKKSRGSASGKRRNTHSVFRGGARAKAEWMQGDRPECDVVISTRVRLARNIADHLFCNRAETSELQSIASSFETAFSGLNRRGKLPLQNVYRIKLDQLDETERELLVERHLISRELAKRNGAGEAIIGEREIVSIMLNEEDHIRFQVINSGLQIRHSWEMVNAIDDELGNELDFAYSDTLGYLTACPTNVGTGLRVSVMFHLPALTATRTGARVLSSVSDMGYAIRGMYGEGSHAIGGFYQISNESTLGQTEEEIIESIQSIARQMMERERDERRSLIEKDGIKVEDRVFRSYGTLVNSRCISSREAQSLLSWVSLGVSTGMLSEIARSDIAQLLVLICPAHLQKYEGRQLDAAARDISRASMIRSVMAGVNNICRE